MFNLKIISYYCKTPNALCYDRNPKKCSVELQWEDKETSSHLSYQYLNKKKLNDPQPKVDFLVWPFPEHKPPCSLAVYSVRSERQQQKKRPNGKMLSNCASGALVVTELLAPVTFSLRSFSPWDPSHFVYEPLKRILCTDYHVPAKRATSKKSFDYGI